MLQNVAIFGTATFVNRLLERAEGVIVAMLQSFSSDLLLDRWACMGKAMKGQMEKREG
jgi:hypothetical protein